MHTTEKMRDTGKLLLRIYIGFIMMYFHGWGKLNGGPELWTKLGGSMSNLGITFAPTFWGFLSMFAEFFVPIFIIIGLFFRPAAFILAFNMLVAMISHFSRLDPWNKIELPMTFFAIFLIFLFIGPGNYSIDAYIRKRKQRKNEV